jgi:hypothetical protein
MLESESNCLTDLEGSDAGRRSAAVSDTQLFVAGASAVAGSLFDDPFFQNVLEWDSIHPSRLPGHGFHSAACNRRPNDADLLWIKSGV